MDKLENRLDVLYSISNDILFDDELFKSTYEKIKSHYRFSNLELNSYWIPHQVKCGKNK